MRPTPDTAADPGVRGVVLRGGALFASWGQQPPSSGNGVPCLRRMGRRMDRPLPVGGHHVRTLRRSSCRPHGILCGGRCSCSRHDPLCGAQPPHGDPVTARLRSGPGNPAHRYLALKARCFRAGYQPVASTGSGCSRAVSAAASSPRARGLRSSGAVACSGGNSEYPLANSTGTPRARSADTTG